jgi:hypothetical protein
MERIELGDNDVVNMPAGMNFTNAQTSRMKELRESFAGSLGGKGVWVSSGVDCEALLEKGDGWRKGKLKLVMVFELEPIPEVNNDVVSVLDDLRNQGSNP